MREDEVRDDTLVAAAYSRDRLACATVEELQATLDEWAWLAPDGAAVAHLLCRQTFQTYRVGLTWDKRGWGGPGAGDAERAMWSAWATKHSALLMPARLAALVSQSLRLKVREGALWLGIREGDDGGAAWLNWADSCGRTLGVRW